MTNEEAIHKMEYSKRAYQMLIDEKVQEGVLVGKGINAEWSADTPIIDAYKDMLEACDMAIKALEQEPSDTVSLEAFKQVMWERDIAIGQLKELGYDFGQKIEPNGDLISREAVIDAIDKWVKNMGVIALPKREGTPLLERIHKLPSVNPQPKTVRGLHLSQKYKDWQFIQEQKTGHWIYSKDYVPYKWKCNQCSAKFQTDYNYCPNCGARMQEVEE